MTAFRFEYIVIFALSVFIKILDKIFHCSIFKNKSCGSRITAYLTGLMIRALDLFCLLHKRQINFYVMKHFDSVLSGFLPSEPEV